MIYLALINPIRNKGSLCLLGSSVHVPNAWCLGQQSRRCKGISILSSFRDCISLIFSQLALMYMGISLSFCLRLSGLKSYSKDDVIQVARYSINSEYLVLSVG